MTPIYFRTISLPLLMNYLILKYTNKYLEDRHLGPTSEIGTRKNSTQQSGLRAISNDFILPYDVMIPGYQYFTFYSQASDDIDCAPPARTAGHLAVFHHDFSPHHGHDRPAFQLPAFIRCEVAVRRKHACSNLLFLIDIDDD